MTFEIEDEAGNPHGPFNSRAEVIAYVADRGLGDERDSDDERAGGWVVAISKND